MTEETLIIGVKKSGAAFAFRPPLYWNPDRGNKGYHSIKWEKTDDGFRVKEKIYVWGTAHEEQAGVSLPEICNREEGSWLWAKEPIPAFPNAYGFYVRRDLADKLVEISGNEAFSRLGTCDDLYERDEVFGFSTVDRIKSKRLQWYDNLMAITDSEIIKYLADSSGDAEVITQWLEYLASTEYQFDQARVETNQAGTLEIQFLSGFRGSPTG